MCSLTIECVNDVPHGVMIHPQSILRERNVSGRMHILDILYLPFLYISYIYLIYIYQDVWKSMMYILREREREEHVRTYEYLCVL